MFRIAVYFTMVLGAMAVFTWIVAPSPGPVQTGVTVVLIVLAVGSFLFLVIPQYRRNSWDWEDRLPDAPIRSAGADTARPGRSSRRAERRSEDIHGPTPTAPTDG